MDNLGWATTLIFVLDYSIRIGLSVRVVARRLPVGTSLAWLSVILIFPFAGAFLYLLLGEYRLGPNRARQAALLASNQSKQVAAGAPGAADFEGLGPAGAGLAHLAWTALRAAPLAGSRLELLENAEASFPSLIADIDRARRTCHLEFYIWSPGGVADEVGAALMRAARRGVACRVLLDSFGSAAFLRGPLVCSLRDSGVAVHGALPGGLLRLLVARPDLRLHRKIVVIDGAVGYTGSLNLADPRLFNKHVGVGQWVDAFVRLQGPAVGALETIFEEDWALETGEGVSLPPAGEPPVGAGAAVVQVLPSGPAVKVEAIEQIVLMAVYSASRELVLTTPYFVPSEALLTALVSAASRGVQVTLIVPARVDSRLVHYASRAHQVDLLEAGVRVALFKGGLLHTKSVTVDGRFSLFGSLNLDPRSMRLDFEVTLAVYDEGFTAALRHLQDTYLSASELLDLAACRSRSLVERFVSDAARLVGPVL